MKHPPFRPAAGTRGSALLIVLAFLFLLTILTVAFLSRAVLERQLSNASFSQGKVDLVGQGAVASIIGDLQQEIVDGSHTGAATTTLPAVATGYYYPSDPTTVIPALVGVSSTATGVEDLLKISQSGTPFYSGTNYKGTGVARASGVHTTTASLNYRSITTARWNAPLLMAKANPGSSTDLTPVGAFTAPDWIYVAKDNTNPTAWSPTYASTGSNTVTQRYAYAIYDEGSTLDLNVAGSPIYSPNLPIKYSAQQPYKNALAYADLTQLPYLNGLSSAQQIAVINAIVGWRNGASAVANSTNAAFPGTATAYNFGTATAPSTFTPFDLNVFGNTSGFLGATPSASLKKSVNSSGKLYNETDNSFANRQELLQFFLQGIGQTGIPLATLQNIMPYLGTFSRDISQPSYAPPVGRPTVLALASGGNSAVSGGAGIDDKVNPSFLNVTVKAPFTRSDNSTAIVGEPLVKKRFALNRLAWITYEGPSATVYASNPNDPNLVALINDGIPAVFLKEGTATNIQNYFGLTWNGGQWKYNNGKAGPIQQITALTTPHDPNFFELLKASIGVGSVAKALSYGIDVVSADGQASVKDQPANYNYYAESSVDFQVLQIGANIIDQFQPANYPVQITFDDGFGQVYSKRTIVGVENLPYLNVILNGVLQVRPPDPLPRSGKNENPPYNGTNGASDKTGTGTAGDSGYSSSDTLNDSGVGAWMQLPVIWNPHDPSSPVGAVGPSSFRVLADSAPPDVVLSGGTYNSFIAYAYSSISPSHSYSATVIPGWGGAIGLGNATQFQNPTNGSGKAEIDFSSPFSATKELCPEPFILMRSTGGIDSNGNTVTIDPLPNTDFMLTDPALTATGQVAANGLKSYVANQPNLQSGEDTTRDVAGTAYVGFYLGAFPLAWPTASAPASAAQSGASLARIISGSTIPDNYSCDMTYRMQYKDTGGNWVTYDTKYGKTYDGDFCGFGVSPPSNSLAPVTKGALMGQEHPSPTDWGFVTDPRTPRFGIMSDCGFATPINGGGGNVGSPFPGPEPDWGNSGSGTFGAGWLSTVNGTLYTARPDGQAGFFCITGWSSKIGPTSGWMAYIGSDGSDLTGLAPGLLSQNNTDISFFPHEFYGNSQGSRTSTPNYFADPDGMVRRGMGAFVPLGTGASPQVFNGDIPPADTTVGLPMARAFGWQGFSVSNPNKSIQNYNLGGSPQVTTQAQSRPYFLHRPFRSVAELGYVFSDTPWRNLDFFTAESGDTALLDMFCINDTIDPGNLVAGKVNLNTRQIPVLQAIIAAGYLDPALQDAQPNPATVPVTERIDSATAKLVAQALVARTTDTTNITNGTGPLENLSELVGKWKKKVAINKLNGLGKDEGVLAAASSFYDGKISYAGFSGGVWDTANQKPYVNGVENFSSSSGAAKAANAAEDVYSAYYNSPSFSSSAYHNGTRETATYIQRFREAPIRALSAAGTTRVWNLMIDVIAQAGRFPSSTTGLDQFNVDGERRYWVHVALDRYTGKVLDEQVEEVKE